MLGFMQTATWVLCLVIIVMFGFCFTKLDKSRMFNIVWAGLSFAVAATCVIRLILHDTGRVWLIIGAVLYSLGGLTLLALVKIMKYEEKKCEEEARRIVIPTQDEVVAINQEMMDIRLNNKRNGN